MKPKDLLLERWEAVLARKLDAPAIFNTAGESVRTFRQVDDRAHDFESKIDNLAAGNVVAVQIGNHEDWPSILIACFQREVVVLPLEQSITYQQRDAAFNVCGASGLVQADANVRKIDNVPPDWNGKAPSLLKLTSGTTAAPR